MSNYWLLSAGKDGELWPAFWTKHRIAIGWPALGDLRQYASIDDLRQGMRTHHPDYNNRQAGNFSRVVWNFYREIRLGELVFIRSFASLLGIAQVEGEYEFLNEKDLLRRDFYSPFFDSDYPHVRKVSWVSLGGGMKQPGTLTKLTVMENPFPASSEGTIPHNGAE